MELAMGRYPFTDNNRHSVMQGMVEMPIFELLQHIVNDPIPRLPARNFSQSFCQFIDLCLTRDAERRPTPLQLQAHQFIRTSQDSKVDMKGWAQSFLAPNLNQRQIHRLSVARQAKKQRGVNVISLLGEAFDEMDLANLKQIGENEEES
jgi:serine/threonine protein kinase